MQTLQENSDAEKESCNVAVRSDEEFDSVMSEKANSVSEKVNMNRVILTNQISEGKKAHVFDSMDKCDIFSLTKDSLLFSQISKNEILSLKEDEFDDTCHMVELKEHEVLTPIILGVEPFEDLVTLQHGIEYHPSAVEIVELIETDMDGDECMEEDEGEYDVELSPYFNRKEKEIGILDTSSKNDHSVLLEMTDRINRTEEAKVTARSSSKIYDVDVHKFKETTLKELKFKKEVEVSRTYQIVGNFNKSEVNASAADECNSFSDSDKEADDVIIFSEDDESNKKCIEDSSSSTDDLYDVCPKSPDQHFIEVGL